MLVALVAASACKEATLVLCARNVDCAPDQVCLGGSCATPDGDLCSQATVMGPSTPSDILFVLDNDGDSASDHEKLAEGFSAFLDVVTREVPQEHRVAIVTTDLSTGAPDLG